MCLKKRLYYDVHHARKLVCSVLIVGNLIIRLWDELFKLMTGAKKSDWGEDFKSFWRGGLFFGSSK